MKTLSVSTPVMNSCSTVRLSKKASDAEITGISQIKTHCNSFSLHSVRRQLDNPKGDVDNYVLVMSLISSAIEVWFASELRAACM